MLRSKWLRAFYIGLQIVFEIVTFPFKILFGLIELIEAIKN